MKIHIKVRRQVAASVLRLHVNQLSKMIIREYRETHKMSAVQAITA